MSTAGKITSRGSTSKGDYFIRYLAPGDAPELCGYINALSQEKTFILFQGEEISLEDEQAYLENQLKSIVEDKLVQLVAVGGGHIIGIVEVGLKDRVERHIGDLAISVAPEWRGLGIGAALMQAVLDEAQTQLRGLELVTLSVFANNETAMKLYHRFGFEEYGRLPQGIIYRGQYVDHIFMVKSLATKVKQ